MFRIGPCLKLLAFFLLALPALHLTAQTSFPIEGYVARVIPPSTIEVQGRQVLLTPRTTFGAMGTETTSSDSPLRKELRVGAYVQVSGLNSDWPRPFVADTVMVHDLHAMKVAGLGVILRVIHPAPDALFEADGYIVHIVPSTKVSFAEGVSSLAAVAENSWIHFSGGRNKDGVVEADRAQFLPAKPTKFKAAKDLEIVSVKTRPAGAVGNAPAVVAKGTLVTPEDGSALEHDQQVKIGLGRWRTLPADQPLQQRIHRIGMALVPEYQRKMPETDPSKIHFRFFAVEDNRLRTDISMLDGVVLIPRQIVERFSSDDEVAALLADGIACNLQRQTARIVAGNRIVLSTEITADIAGAFVPGLGMLAFAGEGAAEKQADELAAERLRMALALMQDAGFDPWQAPEAWRLTDPRKLPADPSKLKYPDESCYQLSILSVQYPRSPAS
jgi:hypothetical protein